MNPLISKVQYKRSENGEFHEIAERNLDDTISLILNYPWNTERSLASIELTCPSITIEHPNGTYLKIGPYFSGKFSLYYLNTNNKVYLKIVKTIEEACVVIKTYFDQEEMLEEFEKYGFIINPLSHFRTNLFEYVVTLKAKITFFKFPMMLALFILFMGFLSYLNRTEHFYAMGIVFMMLFILLLSSPIIYFFFNYLSVDKYGYIQISRGHDEFVFGTIDDKKVYNKQDIAEIKVYGVRNNKSFWSECEVIKIVFKNGEQIQLTSLLMTSSKLSKKIPDHKINTIHKSFPRV